jgi:hypothetical protein
MDGCKSDKKPDFSRLKVIDFGVSGIFEGS